MGIINKGIGDRTTNILGDSDPTRDPEGLAEQWLRRRAGTYVTRAMIDNPGTHIKKLTPILAAAQETDPTLLTERPGSVGWRLGHSLVDLQKLGLPILISDTVLAVESWKEAIHRHPPLTDDENGDLIVIPTQELPKKFNAHTSEPGLFLTGKNHEAANEMYKQLLQAIAKDSPFGDKAKPDDFYLSDVPLFNHLGAGKLYTNPWTCFILEAESAAGYSLVSGLDIVNNRLARFGRHWVGETDENVGVRAVEKLVSR
ncbi:hypothetical protein FWH58_00645 [Candidatus Saccharibacteria bacterium]|nr:hypothetical protein [Candidatus Saccharibacteria bacterium]